VKAKRVPHPRPAFGVGWETSESIVRVRQDHLDRDPCEVTGLAHSFSGVLHERLGQSVAIEWQLEDKILLANN
jgi:hypothetical protein